SLTLATGSMANPASCDGPTNLADRHPASKIAAGQRLSFCPPHRRCFSSAGCPCQGSESHRNAPSSLDGPLHRTPISIDRAADDPRVNSEAHTTLSIGGVTYLPLLGGSQSFGLLILVTRRPHAWKKEEVRLAQHFANFASVALENVRLLNRLAETEGRFKSLVEHIPAILYICDVEPPYQSIYVSPQIETMLGYPASEWSDDPNFFMKIIHPDDVSRLKDLEDEAVRTTGFVRAEYRLYDRRGEIRWMRDEAVLVRHPAGAPIGWNGVLVEITGMKRMGQGLPASPPQGGLQSTPLPDPRLPQA
ncbi:MAG: PAS domain S-box protein, partial [Chloroflexi bacterium]